MLPFEPGPCPSPVSLRIWNEARGLDWNALDLLAEMHGVSDVEILLVELMAIRDYMEAQRG